MYFHSIVLYFVICTCDATNDSISLDSIDSTIDINEIKITTNVTDTNVNTKKSPTVTISYNHTESDISRQSLEDNYVVTWDMFYDELKNTTIKQLEKIKTNLLENYNLDDLQLESIHNLFNDSIEYKNLMQVHLQKIIYNKMFNDTDNFKLSFMELSNQVLKYIIMYNLDKIHIIILAPTRWYKQTLKDKILRQETKIATNHINSHICKTFGICKENGNYTDYLKDWLRYCLSMPSNLKDLFAAVPVVLNKHRHFINFNVKFRQTIKYIFNAEIVVQKDTLDFVDEVLTNRENVVKLVPPALINSTKCLKRLFKQIDLHYAMNETNVNQLNDITIMFQHWLEDDTILIEMILNKIVENMNLNFKSWSEKVQRRVQKLWLDVIALE